MLSLCLLYFKATMKQKSRKDKSEYVPHYWTLIFNVNKKTKQKGLLKILNKTAKKIYFFFPSMLRTAVSSARTLQRIMSPLQYFVTQPLLTMILVTTMVW